MLCDEVRRSCAAIAAGSALGDDRPGRLGDAASRAPSPRSIPSVHYLDGSPRTSPPTCSPSTPINFGSGWFPTLRKRPGCSGYSTVAWALAGPLPLERAVVGVRAARARCAPRDRRRARAGARPRADGASTRRRSTTSARSSASAARSTRSQRRPGRPSGSPSTSPTAWPSSPTAASTSARRSCPTTSRWRAWPSSTTSTGSRSSPTTSCPMCCAATACCVYDDGAGAPIDAGALLPPGPRGARDPRLRRPRLRADRPAAGRRPADARHLAVEPRPGSRATRRCPRHRCRTVFY